MPFRGIFSRHRRDKAPEQRRSPLSRCAPPARGSTPTAQLRDSTEIHRDFSPLLESIQAAAPTTPQQRSRRRGLAFRSSAEGEAQAEGHVDRLSEARGALGSSNGPPPVYGSPAPPSYHSNLDGQARAQSPAQQVPQQNQVPVARRPRRRQSLTILPPHPESVSTLVPPVTIYTLDLGLPSVHVPGSHGQQIEIHAPVPFRPLITPTTTGPSTHPHLGEPDNFMDWLGQQVYESPSESDGSANTRPSMSKWEGWKDEPHPDGEPVFFDDGEARADSKPLFFDEGAPYGRPFNDYKGKDRAFEPADFCSEENRDNCPASNELPLPSDKETTAAKDFKGKGPALEPADFVSDEYWDQMPAIDDELHHFRSNRPHSPPLVQQGESSASGALQSPTQSNLSPAADEFQPASGSSNDNSDPASYVWSSISSLDAQAQEFVPGQIRRMPPMIFRPNVELDIQISDFHPDENNHSKSLVSTLNVQAPEFVPGQNHCTQLGDFHPDGNNHPMSFVSTLNVQAHEFVPGQNRWICPTSPPPKTDLNTQCNVIRSDTYKRAMFGTAQAVFGTGQRPFLENPRRIRRLSDNSFTGSSGLIDPIPTPRQATRISDQANPTPTILPLLRWTCDRGVIPYESYSVNDLSRVNESNGLPQIPRRQSLAEREADNAVATSSLSPPTRPQAPVFQLKVVNASISSDSSSDDEETLPSDPSRLSPSDAEEPERDQGPEVEVMKDDDVAEQVYVTVHEKEAENNDSSSEDASETNKPRDLARSRSILSFKDDPDDDADIEPQEREASNSSSSSSLEPSTEDVLEAETDHLGEFIADFDTVMATSTSPGLSDSSGSYALTEDGLVGPFSNEGQQMLSAIRKHFDMPSDTSPSTIQSFFGRNPEILRALFNSTVPHPRWQFWEANHLREVNVSDRRSRTENVVIARCIAQLEWTEEPVLRFLENMRALRTHTGNYSVTLIMTKTLLKSFAGKESPFLARRRFVDDDETQEIALKKWQETVESRKRRPGSLLTEEVDLEDKNRGV